MYGPFRLLDASKRLIDLLDARGLADEFLEQIRIKLNEVERLMDQEDQKNFVESLDDLILALVKEVEKW